MGGISRLGRRSLPGAAAMRFAIADASEDIWRATPWGDEERAALRAQTLDPAEWGGSIQVDVAARRFIVSVSVEGDVPRQVYGIGPRWGFQYTARPGHYDVVTARPRAASAKHPLGSTRRAPPAGIKPSRTPAPIGRRRHLGGTLHRKTCRRIPKDTVPRDGVCFESPLSSGDRAGARSSATFEIARSCDDEIVANSRV